MSEESVEYILYSIKFLYMCVRWAKRTKLESSLMKNWHNHIRCAMFLKRAKNGWTICKYRLCCVEFAYVMSLFESKVTELVIMFNNSRFADSFNCLIWFKNRFYFSFMCDGEIWGTFWLQILQKATASNFLVTHQFIWYSGANREKMEKKGVKHNKLS